LNRPLTADTAVLAVPVAPATAPATCGDGGVSRLDAQAAVPARTHIGDGLEARRNHRAHGRDGGDPASLSRTAMRSAMLRAGAPAAAAADHAGGGAEVLDDVRGLGAGSGGVHAARRRVRIGQRGRDLDELRGRRGSERSATTPRSSDRGTTVAAGLARSRKVDAAHVRRALDQLRSDVRASVRQRGRCCSPQSGLTLADLSTSRPRLRA
jgi:hypothetical protein